MCSSDCVRRLAAKAAVTASGKTGRPVDPRVAELALCPNCDGVRCMGCVCRDPDHECVDDCPQCGWGHLRETVAAAALRVLVGSPHIAKQHVQQIAWDVAGEVIGLSDIRLTPRRSPECDHESQFIDDELGGHWRCLKCGQHLCVEPCEALCPCLDEGCADCWKLVDEKQELRDKLADHRTVLQEYQGAVRQAYRQIQKFLDGGDRNCLVVAQAILDPVGAMEQQPSGAEDEIPDWHYNSPNFRKPKHVLKPDGRGQGMRVCVNCGRTEPLDREPCDPVGPLDEYRGQ